MVVILSFVAVVLLDLILQASERALFTSALVMATHRTQVFYISSLSILVLWDD